MRAARGLRQEARVRMIAVVPNMAGEHCTFANAGRAEANNLAQGDHKEGCLWLCRCFDKLPSNRVLGLCSRTGIMPFGSCRHFPAMGVSLVSAHLH